MKELKVDAIKNGTVIDHIPANKALSVLSILRPKDTDMVTVGINFASKKHVKKDIVKIENRELTQDEVNSIALIAPRAKLSIIRNFEIVKKTVVQIPDNIKGLAKCSNPSCVTNNEPVATDFDVVSKNPVKLRCGYCERIYDIDYIKMR